ncbi:MAG: GNAT family N-acetyltransferase [Nitrospiraceae bacterium]|nr:GNAT family N-acetyltransferase [Nitrospiraceae bacterium]
MQSHPGDTLIRPMQSDDRDAVIGLLAGSEPWTTLGFSSSDWEKIFAPIPQSRDCFVVTCRGRIAGVGIVRPKFLFGDYLELLGIAPDRKGQGLGRQLLAHIEQVAFARGKNLFACVTDFNQAARVFYAKHGFLEVGRLDNLLIGGSAEILLRKTIGPARAGDISQTHRAKQD